MKLRPRWLLAMLTMAPALAPASAACSVDKIADLPVTMRGLSPTISVGINGTELSFVADSGAFYSVISPGNARSLGLRLEAPPGNLRMIGIGGETAIQVATVKSFGLAGATVPNIQFIVGGSEVGQVGVIGQNVLGLADIEYDLPDGMIRLIRTRDCAKTNLAYWVKPGGTYSDMAIESRDVSRHQTVGTVTVNGKRVQATFDTGAPSSILSIAAAARAGITPEMPGAKPGGYETGFGSHLMRTWIVPVADMKIGQEELRNAHIRIGDVGTGTDMLIGADFFISHRVLVSNTIDRLFFSYTGGPIFNLSARLGDADGSPAASAPAATVDPDPADAEGFSRRGAVAAARHDYKNAIADFTRATKLAPGEPRYLDRRAEIYLEDGQPALAAADIDQAIRLKPADIDARLARAHLRLEAGDAPAAVADVDAVAAIASPSADERLEMASLYTDADVPARAVAEASLWIVNHPDDVRRAEALNDRCYARALTGSGLPLALADCNTAIRLRPRAASMLDSRGLVFLRMGNPDRAIADYDAALAINPRIAPSLYGRGMAKIAKGLLEPGKADIAAAIAIDPKLPDFAKRYGIAK